MRLSAVLVRLKHGGCSNMLAAFSGLLTAQANGYADINMGFGMALTGIGSVVIGQEIINRCYITKKLFSITVDILGCFLGGVIYFLSLNFLLSVGIEPINLKLVHVNPKTDMYKIEPEM